MTNMEDFLSLSLIYLFIFVFVVELIAVSCERFFSSSVLRVPN